MLEASHFSGVDETPFIPKVYRRLGQTVLIAADRNIVGLVLYAIEDWQDSRLHHVTKLSEVRADDRRDVVLPAGAVKPL